MLQIKIKDICPMAMTEDQGFLVRSAMETAIKAHEVMFWILMEFSFLLQCFLM